MRLSLLLPLCLLLALLGWAVWAFNRLVRLRNQVRTAWADIDVQLMRRHDLVPRLVELVKGYSGYEKALHTSLAELRTRGERQASPAARGDLEKSVDMGVSRLIALVEAYPDLKASENFMDLQKQLADTENQIQYARRYYNGAVNLFNNRLQRFPDLLIAGAFNFKAAEFFQLDDDAKATAPGVSL